MQHNLIGQCLSTKNMATKYQHLNDDAKPKKFNKWNEIFLDHQREAAYEVNKSIIKFKKEVWSDMLSEMKE